MPKYQCQNINAKISSWEQRPLFQECPRESPFYTTSTLRLVLGHSIGQHWLKSPPPTVDANSSLITNWGWFEKSLSSCLGGLFCLFAEELLKIKEACLLAISSFRRFWKHQRRLRPFPVMIAETISLACFALLVVVFCCVIKIYVMVQNIRPSRNERARVVYARDNQRPLPVEREPTFHSPHAERGARQHCTCNNANYSGSQAIRRQPQTNDERFGWQSNTNFPYVSVLHEIFFFLPSPPSNIQAVYHHLFSFLTWYDIVLTIFTEVSVANSSHAIEKYWNRNVFTSRVPIRWTDYIEG